jgi:hypothetical protein
VHALAQSSDFSVSSHVPDFYDCQAAHAEWQLCSAAIAGVPAQRLLVRNGGRTGYPAAAQRPLTAAPPSVPAAVMLWDRDQKLRTLALDFDAKNGAGPLTAGADARQAIKILAAAGLHPFADRGPTGGWHVYAVLPERRSAAEVMTLAAALEQQFASFDSGPLVNPVHGCIRPPGSPHKSGGFQRLATDPATTSAALSATPHPDAWFRLLRAFPTHLRRDELSVATPVRIRQPRGLPHNVHTLATSGVDPTRTFRSPSEARFSVICRAVNAGWSLLDLHLELRDRWTWLRESYGQKHHSALARDFRKAQITRQKRLCSRAVRLSDTSQHNTQGGMEGGSAHLALRRFRTYSSEFCRRMGYSPVLRGILRSVIWAGHVQGRTVINVGVRTLAEQADVHFDTAASGLHRLARDGLIVRLSKGTGLHPDVWKINVAVAEVCRPARGRVEGIRRVFRVLGGHLVAEVYEHLAVGSSPVTTGELAGALGYDRRRIHEALRVLAGHELAIADRGRWTIGPAEPNELGRRLGGDDDWSRQHQEHRRHREVWRKRVLGLGGFENTGPDLSPKCELDEFALFEPQPDEWIRLLAGGSPPLDSQERADAS